MSDLQLPNGNQGQNLPQVDMDPSQMEDYTCNLCGNNAFISAVLIKKVSPIMSQNGKPGIAPYMQTFACSECGHVNEQLKPNNEDE